jgi:hypothetical protein
VAIALLQGVPRTVDGQPSNLLEWIKASVGVQGWQNLGGWADVIGLVMFGVLCSFLVRAARKKLVV